jgi:hypothetical protein
MTDLSTPPPGFELGPVIEGTQTVVATDELVEQAFQLRHYLTDGPKLTFSIGYAWEWHAKMLELLGATP